VDGNGRTNHFAYDAAGQLVALTNALAHVIRFGYDAAGNRTNITDARNNALGYSYDALNRLTALTYAPGDRELFAYDAVGNLTNYVTRAGQTNRYHYDAGNRLTNITYLGSVDIISFAYGPGHQLTGALWVNGTATNAHVTFAYDTMGRMTNETQRITTASPKSVSYEYDSVGRLAKLIYPDGTYVTYGYNANGWLTNIADHGTNSIVTYAYDAAGRRVKRALENFTFTDYEYDAAGQVTRIWHYRAASGVTNTISQYEYGYDGAGNRRWVKRANGRGDVYRYDATDQLTNVLYEAINPDTAPSAWTNEVRYVFDAAGNRESVTRTHSGTTSYTANALNQYTQVGGVALGWDANGNPTNVVENGVPLALTYDRENRLIRVNNGTVTVTNTYDAFHRLVERATAGGKLRFVYDNRWRVIAEYDQNDTLVNRYVYGPEIDEPVRMTRMGVHRYYHQAALGTVTEVTARAGIVNERYTYDVYGQPTTIRDGVGNLLTNSAFGNRFLFQGRDRDPDTGLYNFRYRTYSPTLGRFLERDLIRERGGLNLYASFANQPTRWDDPKGLTIWKCTRTTTWGRGRHAYLWDDRPGPRINSCGMGAGAGTTSQSVDNGPINNPDESWMLWPLKHPSELQAPWNSGDYHCIPVEGSEGREDEIMGHRRACINMALPQITISIPMTSSSFAFPAYVPGWQDCHTACDRVLSDLGLNSPPLDRLNPRDRRWWMSTWIR
jgi:RHS repeat-associated protein